MTSDFEATSSAIADLLTLNVPGLADATVHLLAPWDPSELLPDGTRHLAVWPVGENPDAEVTEPLTLDTLNAVQTYRVMVWEDGGEARGVLDVQGASDLLQLQNDMRRMFHPFRTFANVWKVRYRGTRFPERPSQVRVFEMEITVDAALEFAAL